MPHRLSRKWEGRLIVRARIREGKPWIREPLRVEKVVQSDGREQLEEDTGPALNMQFLLYNVEILHEMFQCWGLKPKPTIPRIQREAGFCL